MEKIVIYADGGSRGNPGPAGAGGGDCGRKRKYDKGIFQFFGRKNQ